MIVVDSSALIAILDDEEDAFRYAETITEADTLILSAATLVETGIGMLNRHGSEGARKVRTLIHEAGIHVEIVSALHAQLALEAYELYGKGMRKGAGLNYGDCFAYALAKATDMPLLFKGNDFSQTDIKAAL